MRPDWWMLVVSGRINDSYFGPYLKINISVTSTHRINKQISFWIAYCQMSTECILKEN